MSNLPNQFKDKKKKLTKKEAEVAMKSIKTAGKQIIDFQSRILPRTMVVDVKSSTIKIGNDSQEIKDIPIWQHVQEGLHNGEEFFQRLKEIDPKSIDKVILDNGDGFRVKSLAEFVADVETYLNKMRNQVANIVVKSQDLSPFEIVTV